MMNEKVHQLIEEQIQHWAQARQSYEALQQVLVKELTVEGYHYRIQCNLARIVSSGANVDTKSIQQRPCFLCAHHRPNAQKGIPFGTNYELLVNPFPIFPAHLTIPEVCHVEQQINNRFGDMLQLAKLLTDFTIFYNGPHCGASAPDHMHFQAGNRHFMPIEEDWQTKKNYLVARKGKATLFRLDDPLRSIWILKSTLQTDAEALFQLICQALPKQGTETEPRMNLLTYYENGHWICFIFPRSKHRPACYTAEGEKHLLCSPASVDLGGVFILPLATDFQKITSEDLTVILQEVCLSKTDMQQAEAKIRLLTEPTVQVGILTASELHFSLLSPYQIHGCPVEGPQTVVCQNGKLHWNGGIYTELIFNPNNGETEVPSFELGNVTIGLNFHWERQENQVFPGTLKIIADHGQLVAINIVRVEDYLTSVISSEMSATASIALLKAHAVISRSWLLAQIQAKKNCRTSCPIPSDPGETIRWYNHEDHTLFDVCADDHCQRYQGITRASSPQVREAIADTRGEVLMWQGGICDARFSKCCGGVSEEFRYCWEETDYPYLHKQRDWKQETPLPDLTQETTADKWIRQSPKAFCNTSDQKILSQVLNNYDQETTDFYRWKVVYTQNELAELIHKRSGIDFGAIFDLQPLARGTSGRIWKLKIIGSKRTLILGKELEIRRTLSTSHLYSSAFVIDKEDISEAGIPNRFILTGAGWGHGVGLCQIGAAVMGEKGFTYQEILQHYYCGATIKKLY